MCFSATASFTASAVLGAVGIGTMSKARNNPERMLAAIPLFFGLQQFIEGLIWVSLNGSGNYVLPLTYFYLFFASLWWPIYAPLVVYVLEDRGVRKKIIGLFCIGGAVIGISQYITFIQTPSAAKIVNACIYYGVAGSYPTLHAILYALATVGAGLISSKKIINVFGVLVGISAFIAWRVYIINFASVWCFFAALLSCVIYFYFRSKEKKTSAVTTLKA